MVSGEKKICRACKLVLVCSGSYLPERSDAFMISVIGLINTLRHVFRSVVWIRSRSKDLLGNDMTICITSAIVSIQYKVTVSINVCCKVLELTTSLYHHDANRLHIC